jgi:hypothetical protein
MRSLLTSLRLLAALGPLLATAALAPSCGASLAGSGASPNGYEALAEALLAGGADVRLAADATSAPFMPVPARRLLVNGARVDVFDLADDDAARAQASLISPDASTIGARIIAWLAPPQFYRAGRSIVLYVGDDPVVLSHLERVLGAPIARGPATVVETPEPEPSDRTVPTTRASLTRPSQGTSSTSISPSVAAGAGRGETARARASRRSTSR